MSLAKNLHKDLRLGIVCVGLGLFVYAVGWAQILWLSILLSLGMGFTTRYSKVVLNHLVPRISLPMQYFLAALFAVGLWGVLPLVLHYHTFSDVTSTQFDGYLSSLVIICVVTLVFGYFYYSRERTLQLQQALDRAELTRAHKEAQMLKMRLRLLQSQIEPHFLFNTLANVQALISVEPRQASKMLMSLTALLRCSLERTRQEWVTLGDELKFNQSYLALQKVRLGDRLRVHFDVADDVREEMPFPPLLLQPLIENAVVHGIEPLRGGGDLHVDIATRDKHLVIRLYNDAPSTPGRDGHQGHQVGLSNTQDRLRWLYGDDASFSYRELASQGVWVTMEIPLHEDELARTDCG